MWTDYIDPLERWADSLGTARLTDILGLLLRASAEISRYAQPRLTIETLFLEIFTGSHSPPPTPDPAIPAIVAAAPEAADSAPAKRPAARRTATRRRS